MNQVRGLVRRASAVALRKLEDVAASHDVSTCFVKTSLIDSTGAMAEVQLLHAASLLRVLRDLTNEEALARVREAKSIFATLTPPPKFVLNPTAVAEAVKPGAALYVKRSTETVVREIQRRQSRFLSKTEGRLMAGNLASVELFIQKLLDKRTVFTENDVSQYRGVVEGLLRIGDIDLALVMAKNVQLPTIGKEAAAALADLALRKKANEVGSIVEDLASKDGVAPASETFATQMALLLREKLSKLNESTGVPGTASYPASNPIAGTASDSEGQRLRKLYAAVCHFNIDPGVVFPTDALAIQRWTTQFFHEDAWPMERTKIIMDLVRQRSLLPSRVMLDCLSNWCLSDLERRWLSDMLTGSVFKDGVGQCEGGVSKSVDEVVVYRSALSCVRKDLKRNLVDNRLLHHYAQLLNDGEVEPKDPSFLHFIEECGECHSEAERPARFSFLVPPSSLPVMEYLRTLAPQCTYWRTLLEKKRDCVEAVVAPYGHVHVTVKLPPEHECVQAAETVRAVGHSDNCLLSLPVLYEDEHLLIINKPPHVATSRHALSCTQQCNGKVVDVVSLLLTCEERGATMRRVFRQGQVHRLDTETSGCLVMAKSDVASASLRHQMGTSAAYSQCNKVYIALCVVLEPNWSQIKGHGALHDPLEPRVMTTYRVMRFYKRCRVALVECRIQQGKKHQIRRHLAASGLPILQDVEHGGAACCGALINRVALHASSLSFVHPCSSEVITAVAPLPADMQLAIERLASQ
uniref:Pseudouridine synthase RsuA/RluA-like domain-containing protein n=1 Tax=Trypanosoma congolense (strain IL3000) TaxID=1068625 RepID=G0UJZ3_TRYCI|nr:conserved hypothetical protein [Trypanosoma congolense IL3000]